MVMNRNYSFKIESDKKNPSSTNDPLNKASSMQNMYRIQSFVQANSLANHRPSSFSESITTSHKLNEFRKSNLSFRGDSPKITASAKFDPNDDSVAPSNDSLASTQTYNDDMDEIFLDGSSKFSLESLTRRYRKTRKVINDNLGIACMLLASFMFSFMGISVKMLYESESMPMFQLVFARTLIMFLFTQIHAKIGKIENPFGPKELRNLLLLRGMVSFTGICFSFFAMAVLALGDATALSFTAPIFTGIAARMFLNEAWEIIDAFAAFTSLIGVMFVAKPAFIFGNLVTTVEEHPLQALGILAAIGGALTGSAAFIILRYLGKKTHPITNITSSVVPGVIFSFIFSFLFNEKWIIPANSGSYFWLFFVAASAYSGQFLMARSLQLIPAAKASTVNCIQVFFSFLFEWLLFGKQPNSWSILGAFIIGLSVVGVSFAKMARQKKNELPK